MNRLKKLHQDRQAAVDLIDELLKDNPEGISEEIQGQIDGHQAEIEAFDKQIAILEKQEANKAEQQQLTERLNKPKGKAFIPGDPANKGLSEGEQKDLSGYRVLNVLMAAMDKGKLDGLELEMHQEALVQAPEDRVTYKSGSMVIPQVALTHNSRQFRNDVTTGAGTGGDRIATELPSIIDVLLDNLAVRSLGANVMTGLRGNLDFPVMTAGAEPTEKAETAAADEISPTTALKSMSPKRLPGFIEVTEQLLRQDAFGIEAWLRQHLAELLALRMERMAINGSGSSNQPTGVLNASGLPLVALGTNGAAPDRNTITRLPGTVDVANALMGSLGFLTNPKVKTTLQETKTDAGSGIFVWPEGATTLNSYRTGITNAVPSNLTKGSGTNLSAIVFGNWRDLYIGQWGGIELTPNPYVKMDQGITQLHIAAFYDVLVARVPSFAAVVDAITTI